MPNGPYHKSPLTGSSSLANLHTSYKRDSKQEILWQNGLVANEMVHFPGCLVHLLSSPVCETNHGIIFSYHIIIQARTQ